MADIIAKVNKNDKMNNPTQVYNLDKAAKLVSSTGCLCATGVLSLPAQGDE
jgi:hypothetical protein